MHQYFKGKLNMFALNINGSNVHAMSYSVPLKMHWIPSGFSSPSTLCQRLSLIIPFCYKKESFYVQLLISNPYSKAWNRQLFFMQCKFGNDVPTYFSVLLLYTNIGIHIAKLFRIDAPWCRTFCFIFYKLATSISAEDLFWAL